MSEHDAQPFQGAEEDHDLLTNGEAVARLRAELRTCEVELRDAAQGDEARLRDRVEAIRAALDNLSKPANDFFNYRSRGGTT